MKRQTLTFEDDLEKKIEDWRAEQRPIPPFTEAVMVLIEKGLKKS